MSDEQQPDEFWTNTDGTKTAISDLTEEQAKNILRMLIKNDREQLDYFNAHIMPQITGCIDDLADLARIVDTQLGQVPEHKTYEQPTLGEITAENFAAIEESFNQADEEWKRR